MARIQKLLLILILVCPASALADTSAVLLCSGEPGFPRLEERSPFRILGETTDTLAEVGSQTATQGNDLSDTPEAQRVGDLELKLNGSTAAVMVPTDDGDLSPFLNVGLGEGKVPAAKAGDEVAGFQTYRLGAGVGCVLDKRTQIDLGYHFAAGSGEPEVWDALTVDPEPEGEGHNLSLDLKLSF